MRVRLVLSCPFNLSLWQAGEPGPVAPHSCTTWRTAEAACRGEKRGGRPTFDPARRPVDFFAWVRDSKLSETVGEIYDKIGCLLHSEDPMLELSVQDVRLPSVFSQSPLSTQHALARRSG